MQVSDLGHLEVSLREDKGGYLNVKLREGAHRKYIWWNKSDWLINEKELRKKGQRTHLQFWHCSVAQLIQVSGKAWKDDEVSEKEETNCRKNEKGV